MSKAKDVSDALRSRIETITAANGAAVNIGRKVLRGRRRLDEGHIPCAVITEGDDSIEDSRPDRVKIAQSYMLEGHAECDPDNPGDTAHEIIAALKRAVFGAPERLGGGVIELRYLGRTIMPREDGLGIVAAGIEIEAVFVEELAAP